MFWRRFAPFASLGFFALLLGSVSPLGEPLRTIRAQDDLEPSARRELRVANRGELLAALDAAKPGWSVLLEPGDYRGDIYMEGLRGTQANPIVIASANPGRPATIVGGDSGLHLSSPRYVVVRDLQFEKQRVNGLNIDDWESFAFTASDVVLRQLSIRDVDPQGNHDGIKLSGVRDFLIENCVVEGWGDSGCGIDMVGCVESEISNCLFSGDDSDFACGVQTKGGSREIDVRRCTFFHAGGRSVNIGGSTGLRFFRPEQQGYEAKDILVEDCTFVGGSAPVAFVGVDGAIVRYCTIYEPSRYALRILQENRNDGFVPSRRGRFERNVIAFQGRTGGSDFAASNVGPNTAPDTFRFSQNVWRCLDRPQRTEDYVDLPTRDAQGRYDVAVKFVDAGEPTTRVRGAAELGAGVRPAGVNAAAEAAEDF